MRDSNAADSSNPESVDGVPADSDIRPLHHTVVSSRYAYDCRGSGPYPRHEQPDDSDLAASRLASMLLIIPGSLAASATFAKATTHETLAPSGAVNVTVAKMGVPSLSGAATTALSLPRRTIPCVNSRRRVRPAAIIL
jgi:hypothetical protein